jgi:hypothetical protein
MADDRRPWADRAEELTDWAERWVVRTDRWGGYRPLHERGKTVTGRNGAKRVLGKSLTHPAYPSDRGKVFLGREQLLRHFRATAPEHVIGLHTTAPDNTSRWGAVEIDRHGDTPDPDIILAAACTLRVRLLADGFRPLLTDSNGDGGIHLRILLAEPVPTPRLYAWLQRLTDGYRGLGLTARPETFPKQASILPGKCGNWLRLPGLHHTRPHWARVWDGGGWLAVVDAVAALLTYTGDPPALVPDVPPPPRPPHQAFRPPTGSESGTLARRIAAYMARLPNLGEGQGRDDVAYQFATWLIRDLALGLDVALDWLCRWDLGNRPPKGRERLALILTNAGRYGKRPVGCGRGPDPTPAAMTPTIVSGRRPGHYTLRCRLEID